MQGRFSNNDVLQERGHFAFASWGELFGACLLDTPLSKYSYKLYTGKVSMGTPRDISAGPFRPEVSFPRFIVFQGPGIKPPYSACAES